MDPVAAKFIGAGIACLGMGGAGIGLGATLIVGRAVGLAVGVA